MKTTFYAGDSFFAFKDDTFIYMYKSKVVYTLSKEEIDSVLTTKPENDNEYLIAGMGIYISWNEKQ